MGKWIAHSQLRNSDWSIRQNDEGKYCDESVTRAILMDIRAELTRLNNLLACPNFLSIPTSLRSIEKNTKRRRRTKKAKG